MTWPLLLLAFFSVTVGLIAIGWTAEYAGFGDFLADEGPFHFEVWLTVVSLALAGVGVGLGWLIYYKGKISHQMIAEKVPTIHRLLVNKYYMDEMYQWVIDRMVLSLGRMVAFFDRAVVNDGAVDASGTATRMAGMGLRLAQTGKLYNYGMAMGLGVVALALVWWLVLA